MSEFGALLPEVVLCLAATGILLLAPARWRGGPRPAALLSALALLCAAGIALASPPRAAFSGMVAVDAYARLARLLLLGIMFCVSLTAVDFLRRERLRGGEFYAVLLLVTAGATLMVSSADLILTFLALEVVSVGSYVLAGFHRDSPRATEASLKYFLLGAFATAFLLYGIALLYGETGGTSYAAVAAGLSRLAEPLELAGMALLLVGFGFKLAIAPLHVWAPDVYDGAPTPVTALLAAGVKAAALLSLLRILYVALGSFSPHWADVLWLAAVATMFIGNVTALCQESVKRMLAYSSVAHAGYLLLGALAGSELGVQSVFFYLLAYALMNLGAFAVVQMVSRSGETGMLLEDYQGLAGRSPALAVSFSLFLFSLAGIPATAGFVGKLLLFSAAVERGMYWLVVLAAVNSAVAAYYYIRVIVLMFMRQPSASGEPVAVSRAAGAVIAVSAAGTLLLGLFPNLVARATRAAAASII